MHVKSDSDDVTSFAPSSPSSPKRAAYYVQSPSHDGSKCSSMHANSPSDSPSYSSYARHSRDSSASRVSGAFRWAVGRRHPYSPHCAVIDEEPDYYDYPYSMIILFCVSLVFGVCWFIVWGAAKSFKTDINVLSLSMHHFYLGQGSDMTGVPTKLATMNCSVEMVVHNRATFFGIYVSSMPMTMMYSEIKVASGELERYYQPRNSYRIVSVNLEGSKVSLYGAGASMGKRRHVPMRLVFALRSQGDVVGKLVKSSHNRMVSCSMLIDRHNIKHMKFKQASCTYV